MKKILSLLYRMLIIVVSAIGLYLNFKFLGIRIGILYFTIISNIFCFVFYTIEVLLELLGKLKKNKIYHLLKGTVIMSITLTLAVYQLVLADKGIYDGHMMACNFVHLYAPLLIMLDYVIFSDKGKIGKWYPILWSLGILLYGILCELYIFFGGSFLENSKYPYFFLDIDKFGTIGVARNLIIIYLAFVIYGYLIYYVDHKIFARKK